MIKSILGWFSGINVWLWIAIAALVASGWGYGAFKSIQVQSAQKDVEALTKALSASEAEVEQLRNIREADAVATQARTDEGKVIQTKEAKGHAETVKALEANPSWANAPIPDDVLDSLRK